MWLTKCKSCLYFSRDTFECLKFGKKLVPEFYSALVCRLDESKCGTSARWYLEKLQSHIKRDEVDVHSGGSDEKRR
jgi:hypothetical protein